MASRASGVSEDPGLSDLVRRTQELQSLAAGLGDSQKRMLLLRAVEAVKQVIASADDRALFQALSAPTDMGALARALADDTVIGRAVAELDPDAELIAAGAERKRDLLEKAGGSLGVTDVAALLRVSRQAVDKKRRAGKLIGILVGGDYRYPACQFTAEGIVRGLEDALSAMPIESPWMRLEWLVTPDAALGGRGPLQALGAGDRDDVIDLARGHGA